MCTHVLNAKIIPAETLPAIWGEGIKESSGGGGFKYNIFHTLQELL
jgi:hypothetical protein